MKYMVSNKQNFVYLCLIGLLQVFLWLFYFLFQIFKILFIGKNIIRFLNYFNDTCINTESCKQKFKQGYH